MTFSNIKAGMTLQNTNSTTYVIVTEVEKYGFIAKKLGNCIGTFDTQNTGKYSKYSVDCGSWKIK